MSLAEDLSAEQDVAALHRRIAKLVSTNESKANELKTVKRELANTTEELEKASQSLGLIRSVNEAQPKIPKWRAPVTRKTKSTQHNGIPTLLLSDLHLDEVVNPAEVEWYNSYNRSIAEMRLQRTFEQAIDLARNYTAGVNFDGFTLALGGDLLSGDIHMELARTNEATVFESIVHWIGPLAAGIEMLADEFGKVFIPCVTGNHDRNPANKRAPAKQRARDTLCWVIYQWLADRFRDDPRITFQIAEGADTIYQLYDTKYMLTHGDQFRGGNGIAGIFSPLMRGYNFKARRQGRIGAPFDWMVMGHFHQYLMGKGIIVNGTLKGYDEYAYVSNFEPEPPCQAFWVTTPEHGITLSMPIFSEHPKEGWR